MGKKSRNKRKMALAQSSAKQNVNVSGLPAPVQKTQSIQANYLSEKITRLVDSGNYQDDEIDQGRLFADCIKDQCLYNRDTHSWWKFHEGIFVEDTSWGFIGNLAVEFVRALQGIGIHWVKDYMKLSRRERLIKEAQLSAMFENKGLDANDDLFNCKNGTFNLRTFEFSPHRPEDLMTKMSGVAYDPSARSELFENFINTVLCGDEEKINLMQEIIGYILTAETTADKMFLFYGKTTRNGKSTLVNTLQKLMGEDKGYAKTSEISLLTSNSTSAGKASEHLARLDNTRFVSINEPKDKTVLNVATIKKLTGGDTQNARMLYQNSIEFKPKFKMVLATNNLPCVNDDTLFKSNRAVVITFEKHFEVEEIDEQMESKLTQESELSGIFNWAVEGLKRYREQGTLMIPESVKKESEDYASDNNFIDKFREECLVEATKSNLKGLEVYTRFKQWYVQCKYRASQIPNRHEFYDLLKEKGIMLESGTVDGKTYYNVVCGFRMQHDIEAMVTLNVADPVDEDEIVDEEEMVV